MAKIDARTWRAVAGGLGLLALTAVIATALRSPAKGGAGDVTRVVSSHPEADRPTLILVDKKHNTLELAYYDDKEYEIIKSYHTTVGRVVGDKEEEGDLKTPEGIYHFKSHLRPPELKAKFGVMAFPVNYPNPYDEIAGRTGSAIMLHATNEPERLKKDFDSEGCVVVNNDELKEIAPYIRLNLTPILIFADLSSEWRKPLGDPEVKKFFEKWVKDWESKSLDAYIGHYHSDFKALGMNKSAWKEYKGSLNKRYETISVGPSHIEYFRHPKYTVITFTQDYKSDFKGGRPAYRSKGTKILHVAEEDGDLKIISEHFTQAAW